MRIIAGEWRRRPITAPRGDATRPTADRTRETLFAMLTSRLGDFTDLSVVDLFAGSGALGLEALSRGAAHCLFVEEDRDAAKVIRQNIATFGALQRATVTAGSVFALGPAAVPHDLLLLDPPYDSGAGVVALDRLLRLGWIGTHSWIALETGAKETPELKDFAIAAERVVGKAKLTLLRRANP